MRPANYDGSWLLREQQMEYLTMFSAAGGFGYFRSLITAVGMSVMYRWEVLSTRICHDELTVVDKYVGRGGSGRGGGG